MIQEIPFLKIERRAEVLSRTGFSRSTLYVRINQGLFVPPVNLGGRAVGYLEHEVSHYLAAIAAGKSNEEIQEIVTSLLEKRASFLEAYNG